MAFSLTPTQSEIDLMNLIQDQEMDELDVPNQVTTESIPADIRGALATLLLRKNLPVQHYKVNEVNRYLRGLSEACAFGHEISILDFEGRYGLGVFLDCLYRGRLEKNYAVGFFLSRLFVVDYEIRKYIHSYFRSTHCKQVVHRFIVSCFMHCRLARRVAPELRVPTAGPFVFIHPAILEKFTPEGLKTASTYVPATTSPSIKAVARKEASRREKKNARVLKLKRAKFHVDEHSQDLLDVVSFEPMAVESSIVRADRELLQEPSNVMALINSIGEEWISHTHPDFNIIYDPVYEAPSAFLAFIAYTLTGVYYTPPVDIVMSCSLDTLEALYGVILDMYDSIDEELTVSSPPLCAFHKYAVDFAENFQHFFNSFFSQDSISIEDGQVFDTQLLTLLNAVNEDDMPALEAHSSVTDDMISSLTAYRVAKPKCVPCSACIALATLKIPERLNATGHKTSIVDGHYVLTDYPSVMVCVTFTISQELVKENPSFEAIGLLLDRCVTLNIEAHGLSFSSFREVINGLLDFSKISTAVASFMHSVSDVFKRSIGVLADWLPTMSLIALVIITVVVSYVVKDSGTKKMIRIMLGAAIGCFSVLTALDAVLVASMYDIYDNATDLFVRHSGDVASMRNATFSVMTGKRIPNIHQSANYVPKYMTVMGDDTPMEPVHRVRLHPTVVENPRDMDEFNRNFARRAAEYDAEVESFYDDPDEIIPAFNAHAKGFDALIAGLSTLLPGKGVMLHLAHLRQLFALAKDVSGIATFFFELLPVIVQTVIVRKFPNILVPLLYKQSKWTSYSVAMNNATEKLKSPDSAVIASAKRLAEEARAYVIPHCSEGWANHAETHLEAFTLAIKTAEAKVATILFGRRPVMIEMAGIPQIGKTTALRQLSYFLSMSFSGTDNVNLTYQVPPEKYWENVGDSIGCLIPELYGTSDERSLQQIETIMALADGSFKPSGASIARKDQYLDMAYCCAGTNKLYATGIPTFNNWQALYERTNLKILAFLSDTYKGVDPSRRNTMLQMDPDKSSFPHLRFAFLRPVPPSMAHVTTYNALLQHPDPALLCPVQAETGRKIGINAAEMTYPQLLAYLSTYIKERADVTSTNSREQYDTTKALFSAINGTPPLAVRETANLELPAREENILAIALSFALGSVVVGTLAMAAKSMYDAYHTPAPDAHYGARPRGKDNLVRRVHLSQARNPDIPSHATENTPDPTTVFLDRVRDGLVTVVGSGGTVRGFLLDQSTVVTVAHAFRPAPSHKLDLTGIARVTYTVEGQPIDVLVNLEQDRNIFVPDLQNDVCLIRLPIVVPGIRQAGRNLSYYTRVSSTEILNHVSNSSIACYAGGDTFVAGTVLSRHNMATYNNVEGGSVKHIFRTQLTAPLGPGDCGAPVWGIVQNQPVILGMYVGGIQRNSYFARLSADMMLPILAKGPVSRQVMMGADESFQFHNLHAKTNPKRVSVDIIPSNRSPHERLPPLFRLSKSNSSATNTRLLPTPFKDGVLDHPCRVAPSILDPKLIFEQELKYAVERIPMKPSELAFAERVVDLHYTTPKKPLREWTLEEAINVIPQNASVGFGWNCKREELMPLVETAEGSVHVASPYLVSAVNALLDSIDQGIVPCAVILPCLKDETRPLAKVAAKQTRTFQISGFEWLVVGGMVLGDFMDYLHKNPITTPSTVGLDPASLEWDTIFSHLFTLSADQKLVDLDYKSMEATLLWQMFESYLRFTTRYYLDYGKRTWFRRRAYLLAMCQSIMATGYYSWWRDHGNPSGMKGTTDVNTYAAAIYAAYAFHGNIPEARPTDYSSYVRNVFNGDDTILAVSEIIKSRHNYNTIAEQLLKLGVVITPANKDGPPNPFVEQVKVQFCKKQILYSSELGAYVPFVTFHTLLDQLSWVKDPSPDGLIQVVNSALQWSFFRGNLRENGQIPSSEPTFDEQRMTLCALLPSGQKNVFDYDVFYERFLNPRELEGLLDVDDDLQFVSFSGGLRNVTSVKMLAPIFKEHCAPEIPTVYVDDLVDDSDYTDDEYLDVEIDAHFGFSLGPFHLGIGEDPHGDSNPPPTPVPAPTDTRPTGIVPDVSTIIDLVEDVAGLFAHSAPLDPPNVPSVGTAIDQAEATTESVTMPIPASKKKMPRTVAKIDGDKLAAKWYQLDKMTLNGLTPNKYVTTYENPLSFLVGNAAMQMIKGRYCTFDVRLRFVVTTGSFSGGLLLAAYVPYEMGDPLLLTLTQLCSLPHVEIDVSDSTPKELHIPYTYLMEYYSFVDIHSKVLPSAGSVVLFCQTVMNPTTSAKPVSLTVHFQIENLETYVPINIPPCVKDPMAAFNALQDITLKKKPIPLEADYEITAHSQAIRNGELWMPGFDDGQPTVILGDATKGTHHGKVHHSLIEEDEMSHAFFVHKPVVVDAITLNAAAPPTIISTQDISPWTGLEGFPEADGKTPYFMTPLEWASCMHMMWHGSIRWRLEYIAPRESTVRIAACFLYGIYPDDSSTVVYEEAIQYPTIYYTFDSTHRELVMEAPDINTFRWKIRPDLARQEIDFYGNSRQPRTSNGTLVIFQVTQVSGINVPLTVDPYVNIWKCGGSDFTHHRFSPMPGLSFDRHVTVPPQKTVPVGKNVRFPAHSSLKPKGKENTATSLNNATGKSKASTPREQNTIVAISPIPSTKIPVVRGGSFADQCNRPVIFYAASTVLAPGKRLMINLPPLTFASDNSPALNATNLFEQMAPMYAGWSGDAVYDIVVHSDSTSGDLGFASGSIPYDTPMDGDPDLILSNLIAELPIPYAAGDSWPSGYGFPMPTNSQVVASMLPLVGAQIPMKMRVIVPYINPVRYANTTSWTSVGTQSFKPPITGFAVLWNSGAGTSTVYVTVYKHAAPGARLHHFKGMPKVYLDSLVSGTIAAPVYTNYPGTIMNLPS